MARLQPRPSKEPPKQKVWPELRRHPLQARRVNRRVDIPVTKAPAKAVADGTVIEAVEAAVVAMTKVADPAMRFMASNPVAKAAVKAVAKDAVERAMKAAESPALSAAKRVARAVKVAAIVRIPTEITGTAEIATIGIANRVETAKVVGRAMKAAAINRAERVVDPVMKVAEKRANRVVKAAADVAVKVARAVESCDSRNVPPVAVDGVAEGDVVDVRNADAGCAGLVAARTFRTC